MTAKRLSSVISIVFILFLSFSLFGQSTKPEKVIRPVGFDKSPDLSTIRVVPPGYRDRTFKERVIPNRDNFQPEFKAEQDRIGPDPVLQDSNKGQRSLATVGQNFEGVNNLSGVAPPDTDGDVGPNHYMQMVNLAFEIFDKSGYSLYGPADNSTLWAGFTGPWSGTNDGDPIVLYDEHADRWIASQFALPNYPSGPFYELIAVSATGDPTGSWYRYAYEFNNMPDYPKFGVWPDGYYFTINQFAPPSLSFAGAGVCVVDRNAMINGDPTATMLFFNLGTSYGSLLPADADGPMPPAGTPNYLANLGTSYLRIWEADIDWAVTSNSTISLVTTVPVSSYSYSGISINQPGTSQTLDALASRLMYRLQYRNFGAYQVMLTNHTVNNGSGKAGVRWYELRNSGSGWTMYQQGTFAPADGDNRWMGSVAMNGNGDIGIGYSVSGSSTYPSIRFAGQTVQNSGTGILDVSETSIKEGTSSQTGVNRWGDYSMMAVDPVDDQTFWYTTEFSNGGWNWRTQIASFNFEPPVIEAPVADFTGNPTSVMEGQSVSFTDLSTHNPDSWSWSFPGGTPSSSTLQNPVVSYPAFGTYDVSLTVSNSAGNDTETKTGYITVTEYVISYCASSGNNTSSEWIQRVDLGSFSNNSGNNGGYLDATGSLIGLESGGSYDLTLVPGFSNRSRREFWRVWIDYNMDGDFLDSGEEVFAADARKNSVSGSITLPSGMTGETRMRVSMKYNGIPGPCEQFTYGEVEDYQVNITEPVPLPPVADFTASSTSVAPGTPVDFSDLSLNEPTSWTWSFEGGTPSNSTLQNPTVTYETEGSFTVSLTVTNDQGTDVKTVAGYITVVTGGGGSYCASSSGSNDLEWISTVAIGPFSNASGAALYSDFTGMVISLTPGSSSALTLSPGYSGSSEREFWRVWIDFNMDGDFEDSDETLFIANNKKNTVTGTLAIPSYASGETRMRISMKHGSSPGPCEVFGGGEVEDYTVNFGSGGAALIQRVALDLEIKPNPVEHTLYVAVLGEMTDLDLKLYDAFGRIIREMTAANRDFQLDVTSLTNGIYYLGADNGKETVLKRFIKE